MRKLIATLVALLGLAAAGCASLPQQEIHGGAQATRTPYTTRAGFIPNPKATLQETVWLESENFSGYAWKNEKPREVDIGVAYSKEIAKNVKVRIGPQLWFYPGKDNPLGADGIDYAAEAGLNMWLPGGLNFDATLTHVFPDKDTERGDMVSTKLTRPVSLGKLVGLDFTLTPEIGAAYLKKYYGADGFSQVTPGISVRAKRKTSWGNWFLEAFWKKQLGNKNSGMDDFNYTGFSLGAEF